jgi:hypothetical protein
MPLTTVHGNKDGNCIFIVRWYVMAFVRGPAGRMRVPDRHVNAVGEKHSLKLVKRSL